MTFRSSVYRIVFILTLALFPWLVMGPVGSHLTSLPLRLGVFALLAWGGSWLLQQAWKGLRKFPTLLLSMLIYAVAYKIAAFLPDVSNYPFSLGWSEISRYYYASLFFAERLYGMDLPLSVLHPTRYLMQSLPFLIPDSSLWLHRFWQVVLWIGTTMGASWLLWRRLQCSPQAEIGKKDSTVHHDNIALGFILFAMLFFFQGPVYYHLLVMVILVLASYHPQKPWRTLIIVLLASVWAGLSRINWLPVPGMMAAGLYFLEKPLQITPDENQTANKISVKHLSRYLLPPVVWVLLGTAVAYGAQEIYKLASGNPPEVFGSSFNSDLLWYRLLPNATYPLGILPSALLVTLPLLSLAGLTLARQWKSYHPLRVVLLASMLLVLFAGGIVVSVKIGGGSNLHNLDAFLTLLLVICSYLILNKFTPDNHPQPETAIKAGFPNNLRKILLLIVITIPCYFSLSNGGPYPVRDFSIAQEALQTIGQQVAEVASEEGEVLFISQRHLLTFDMLGEPSIRLIPDYELVFLMEMAMGNNRPYLNTFQQELQAQRYELIVSGPLTTTLQGKDHSFGEENDAWVRKVAKHILCYYEPVLKLKDPAVMLLTPKASPCK